MVAPILSPTEPSSALAAPRPLTVAEVLALPQMQGAQTLAGSRGLDKPVSRLNMMEVPDVLPWVRRDEIVVTSGYPLRKFTDEDLIELLEGLVERGVSAIIVKVGGRYLEDVSRPVRDRAEELRFPILSMPLDLAFSDLQESFFSEVLTRHRTALTEESNSRIFGEYLALIITARPSADEDELRDMARHLGVEEPQPVRVAVVRGSTRLALQEYRAISVELVRHLAPTGDGLILHPFTNSLVLVVPEPAVPEVSSRLEALATGNAGPLRRVRSGFGNRADRLTQWRVSYSQAQRALELSELRQETVVHYSTLGLDQVLEALEGRGSADSFVDETLGPLLDQPELITTLHAALGHSMAVGPTATELHFHYNTIRNRLRRVEELIGSGLDLGRRRAELIIACELWARQQRRL